MMAKVYQLLSVYLSEAAKGCSGLIVRCRPGRHLTGLQKAAHRIGKPLAAMELAGATGETADLPGNPGIQHKA
jgi:hypothetical protein